MTTRITRIDGETADRMVLKLEGTLSSADARLLEEICEDLGAEMGYGITIDLASVNYLSKEGAKVLCRLKTMPGLDLKGMHLFVQQILELTEAVEANGNEKDGQ